MTTDTTALQERIARAIRLADTGDTLPDGFAARMWDEGVTNRDKGMRLAAAVLPIIAAEVRKAQADAWDEGYAWGCFDDTDGFTRNPYREESYE